MERIPPERTALLWEWDAGPIALTAQHLQILEQIGATEADHYGNGRGVLKVPCAIRAKSNEVFDPCLLQITKRPPIAQWQKHVRLGTMGEEIFSSNYALPLEVRLAALQAEELRMGFSPTVVESKDGRTFVLNGSANICSYGSVQGKDLILSHKPFSFSDATPILTENIVQMVYMYFDWYAGCERLIRTTASL
jgi:hypothetical protein